MTVTQPSDQAARERIREDLDSTLFVEAGAGTGKTSELVRRIVRLVASGRTEMQRIAAITFTEAAAAELRDRVRIELEKAAGETDSPSSEERTRCEAALAQVDAAAVETLHGFARRILAGHPLEAGLPPSFDVLDEIGASITFEERWTAFVDDLLADQSLEETLLRAFTLGLTLEHLHIVALEFHRHRDRLEDVTIDVGPLRAVDAGPLVRDLEQVCELRASCQDPDDGLYRHLEGLDMYRRRLAAAETDLVRLSIWAEGTRMKCSVGRRENWDGVTPSDVRGLLTEADQMRSDLLWQARSSLLSPLLAAIRHFILKYAEDRRRQGRLEFHDLLVQARDLLRRDALVRSAVREQFSHLLIDEFQDTDPIQTEMAVLLAAKGVDGKSPPWHEASIEAGRLFFVGDPKQSIYRFRRADIVLYQAVQERFSGETVRLTQNFRSVKPVIDWVNHIFAGLMAEETEGQATYVPIEPWWEPPETTPVTVHVLGGPSEGLVSSIRQREAAEIARIIEAAKAEGWPVGEIQGSGERVIRRAQYADIAILMPTRTTLPPIEQALEEEFGL
ncbi:MAG: DNA helicase UvrD, partial [Dehalococcoidia bacterium]